MNKKHYIVTFEGRLWVTVATNPKEAINQVITDFNVKGKWGDFKAYSIYSCTKEQRTVEFKVVDA